METSVRLGRVAGIDIGINWSVVVIAWLICYGIASDALPTAAPGYATGAYWAVGAGAAVLFFSSLLLHELGHSLVARRHGVNVREITLWMLGGVAKLEGESPTPEAELRIAAAGPAVSMVLGVVFLGLAASLEVVGASDLFVAALGWLGSINILLAVFNLMPAFPTDGGRLLRAWLWRRSGDHTQATRTAARVGTSAGWGLVFLGILALTGGGGIGGIWLAMIGLFLVFASNAEATLVEQQHLLEGLLVGHVMTPSPITAPADITVQELLDRYVLHHHVSSYPLLDGDGRLVGIATLRDIRRVTPADRPRVPVRRVATRRAEMVVATASDPMSELLPKLVGNPVGRAVVMDGDHVRGIVSLSDVTRALEARALVPTREVPTHQS